MYKIYTNNGCMLPGYIKKFLLVMKITTFLLFVAIMQVSAKGLAQRLTLVQKNVTLKQVFKEINKQTGYNIFWSDSQLDGNQKINADFKNVPLMEVLDKCLENKQLTYTIENKTVVIKEKPATVRTESFPALPVTVSGRVTDSLGTPLIGATVAIKGSKSYLTNDKGEFALEAQDGDIVTITFIGYNPYTFTVSNNLPFQNIVLHASSSKLQEVVISTGYQTLPKERATGSFGVVNNELFNREVSTNVLDRLNGTVAGLYFNSKPVNANSLNFNPQSRTLGLTVRGVSTLSPTLVGTDPLIVLDNFPYDGDIANINPNDIESVTVLKDAAAASIWGARAGNGVIVLTTKKGRFNSRMKVEVNSSITIGNKPDIFKDRTFLNSNDFINVEDTLFKHGYFNSDISNTYLRPALSPVIAILAKQRAGLLSVADANSQIDALRNIDVRNDFSKYFLQKSVNQQHSVGIRGGANNMTYALSVGYDNNKDALVHNGSNRTTIDAANTYAPIKNLEISTRLNYNVSQITQGNFGGFPGRGVNGKYGGLYPYAQLADAQGNPLPVATGHNSAYVDSVQKLGFLNWQYKPLDELNNGDNTTHTTDFLINLGARYKITSWLNAELQYQNESQKIINRNYQSQQTYYVRDLINQFSTYDPSTQLISYQFPLGGVLNLNNTNWNSYNWRGQLSVNKNFNEKHSLTGIAGAEIRQLTTEGYGRLSYGYDPNYGTATNNLDYVNYLPINPAGTSQIPYPSGDFSGITNRYLDYFANAAYTYADRYTFSLSGRKDGANLFGVRTNDKITPLWSAGAAWDISKEAFYKLTWLPYLKLRTTYGYNGNVYNGTAYVTGQYATFSQTGAQSIFALTPSNPDLRWEKVRNINIGVDFSSKNNQVYGSIEIYQKDGQDLIETVQLPASVGFTSFNGNAASTQTKGVELTLTTKIVDKKFKWSETLLTNLLTDKVTKYDPTLTNSSILASGQLTPVVGKSLFSIFSYKWAGLDPTNGDPQGYINGKVSKNYSQIINNSKPDSLIYSGSARPTVFGSLRNDFYYKGFSLSVMLTYKLGYYFRRASSSPNYADAISFLSNSDYSNRWEKPGDEKITDVPSFVYPSNPNRAKFYQYSDVLIQKGDHVRLQDIRLSYNVNTAIKRSPFSNLQVFAYANNLGILWRANKFGIDPDNYSYAGSHVYPNPFTISFGIHANY